MSIEVEASCVVPRKVDEVFTEAAVKTENLARYFSGYGPLIPGITGASIDDGGPAREGALRTVKLSDGTQIRERILRFEAPRIHTYDMAEMNFTQKLLCTNMVSEWRFEDVGGATRVTWRYAIHPKNFVMLPLCHAVGILFRRAMQRCLDDIAKAMR